MNKINITIEKEYNLQLILDEILKLKEEEIKLDSIYKNMIKKIDIYRDYSYVHIFLFHHLNLHLNLIHLY